MASVILVRYGELALKSPPVRREFEHALQRNILGLFAAAGVSCRLRSDHGHLYVEVEEAEPALGLLRRVFGVTSVSQVWPVVTDRSSIEEALLTLAEPHLASGRSFAVRARRTGNHPFTSQELARDLGAAVLDRYADRQLHVDLDHPDVELFVEVRDKLTYLSLGRARGPGGLPIGVAGRVVAFVDGRRGALGAWLMMKRGCRASVVASPVGAEFADSVLSRFDPTLTITHLEATTPSPEAMLEQLAESVHADAVVLPLGVEEYTGARERWGERVVFSPTVGLSDAEVDERWHAIVELAG